MSAPPLEQQASAAALAALLEQALAREQPAPARSRRVEIGSSTGNGLAQLVLALVKLLHELLERQALRRIEADSLSEDEIERLGFTLMRQAEEIDRLAEAFGLSPDELNLDLGPIGRLL